MSEDYFNLPKITKNLLLPHDPARKIAFLMPVEATVFKSAQSPLKITFKPQNTEFASEMTTHNGAEEAKASFIYKSGDNLHHDQVILQIIKLMDEKLQENLIDCKLCQYQVLATGSDHGRTHCHLAFGIGA